MYMADSPIPFACQRSLWMCFSHLSVPSEEIEDLEMLKEKLEITNPILSVIKEMMNVKILLNPLFALICISNIFGKYYFL